MTSHRSLIAPALLAMMLGIAGCADQPRPAASAPAAPAVAQPPPAAAAPSVADLAGARGSSGEMALGQRGYTRARSQGLTSFYWHPAGACVRVVTNQGRYQTVENVAASNCGR